MKQLVATAVSSLLLGLATPSRSQTAKNPGPEISNPAQSSSQISNAHSSPSAPLTGEEIGDLYMARKEYYKAAEAYLKMTEQDPRNAVYLNKLGMALQQQSALDKALKYYKLAMKRNPRYADAQNNIGAIWYERKNYSRAVKAFQKAIKIRSDMPVVYSNMGYAYFGEKKYKLAISSFRTALDLDPRLMERNAALSGSLLQDNTVSDRGRFYFLLARSFAESGKIDRCLVYLRKAKDEGYATLLDDVKKDTVFSAALNDPDVHEFLWPKPPSEEQQR
jgi:tetratricopeptide (TPR) repeat protein